MPKIRNINYESLTRTYFYLLKTAKLHGLEFKRISFLEFIAKLVFFILRPILKNTLSPKAEVISFSYTRKDSVKPNFSVCEIDLIMLGPFEFLKYITICSVFLCKFFSREKNFYIMLVLFKSLYMLMASVHRYNRLMFWGYSYTLEVKGLFLLAKETNSFPQGTTLFESVSFVEPLNYVHADCIVHPSYIQSSYLDAINSESEQLHYCLTNQISLLSKFDTELSENERVVIGFFASGAKRRSEIGSMYRNEYLFLLEKSDIKTLCYLSDFVNNKSNYKLIIFPHYKRDIETLSSAQIQYSQYATDSKITVATPENFNSYYEKVRLSVSTKSNVFWDFIYAGRKALLLNPYPFDEFMANSDIKTLCIEDSDLLEHDELANIIEMSEREFYFDRLR